MHPLFQRYFGQSLANEDSKQNLPANPNSKSPQRNPNAGPNFSQPTRVHPRSEYLSNQVHPMIENGWNGGQPMEFNDSKPYYSNLESQYLGTNSPVTIEKNGPSSQQGPEALKDQSKFNARFQQLDVNSSQFSPQATTANAPTPYQLHQWVNGSLNTFVPIAVNDLNPQRAQGEFDNGLGFSHLDFNLVYTPQCTIPLSELHVQLTSIAREIKLRNVESINAASEHMKPQGNEEFFMLYLVVLGQYILQGGSAWYTNLPPPAPKLLMSPRATKSLSSSPIPFKLEKVKRESKTNDRVDENKCAPKKVNPIDTTNWDTVLRDPVFFELEDVDHSVPLDSEGILLEPEYFEIYSEYSTSSSIHDGGFFSSSPSPGPGNSNTLLSTSSMRVRPLSPCAPVFVPASESNQTVSSVDGDHEPLESPDNKVLSKSHSEPTKARTPRVKSVSFVDEKMLTDPFITNNSSNTTTPSVGSLQRTRSYLSTPPTPISPFLQASPSAFGSPSPRELFVAQGPLQIPGNICFIRTNPGSGIRVCVFPENTWVDLPQIGIHHCNEDLPEIHYVMGSASWFYTQNWVPILYQEILTYNSLKRFEELRTAPTQSAPEPYTIPTGYVDMYGRPTFFQACNSRPESKAVSCPSGDDLGVNWNATLAERMRIRLTKVRQMWEEWQEGARDVRFLWHLWKRWGRIKGWTEKKNGCGDNAKAEEMDMTDHYQLMMIVMFTSRQGFDTKQISFEDKKNILDGRSIEQFNKDWEERQRKFGSSNWLE
ncbi:uncharacterized protein Bfra_003192 [Botrytis fragariae]|uniref:Uncharacterized protein n=1 Tax=Botrytis fragariae TaxID=1964551 RepID=A0A8H6B0A9_9HELO|nr:uncharacterized protein Bfra_003192 [Botrytis fragariae]KAF5876785.1 hypothetical protein Bfra_003192 [Botrytis fragariae]